MRGLAIVVAVVAVAVLAAARPWSHKATKGSTRPVEHTAVPIARFATHTGPHRLDRTTLRARGIFVRRDGGTVTVAHGFTNDRQNECVVATSDGSSSVACDPTPFEDSPVQFLESFSAGPGGKPFHEWSISGLALSSVKRIELTDSSGRSRPVALDADGAFFFELSRPDLAHGTTAVSLLLYGADGDLIKEVQL